MTQWLVALAILIVGALLLPMQVRSTRRWRKGRTGGVMASFADGVATALDPSRRIAVEAAEKRRDMDGEEAGGEDEPLHGSHG